MHVSNALVLLCIRFLGCNNFSLNPKLAMFRQAVSAHLYIKVIKAQKRLKIQTEQLTILGSWPSPFNNANITEDSQSLLQLFKGRFSCYRSVIKYISKSFLMKK